MPRPQRFIFSYPWTGIYTIGTPASQAFVQTPASLGHPACKQQILRLFGLHNLTSQFLIINLHVFTSPIGSVSPRTLRQHRLTWAGLQTGLPLRVSQGRVSPCCFLSEPNRLQSLHSTHNPSSCLCYPQNSGCFLLRTVSPSQGHWLTQKTSSPSAKAQTYFNWLTVSELFRIP